MRSTLLVLGVGVLISIWISVATCKQIASETRLASAKTLDQEIQDEFNATVSSESFSVAIQHKKHRRYIPFARPLRVLLSNTSDCPEDDGDDDDFPDFLDIEVVKHGGFILCILIGIYCFTLLAVVCDNYFLPCVETICDILGISPDVAAATFMSVATSCPELFTNIIGTFVTESDLGIGTIVGSSLFNGLGVAAIGGLAAPYPLQLDWWPLTRDCTIYIFAICCLVVISWDGVIYWYEASILFVVYFAYFIIIFNSKHVEKFVKRCIGKDKEVEAENPQPKGSIMSAYGTYSEEAHKPEHRKELERAEQLEKEDRCLKYHSDT